jgi:hypothetical protein
MCLFFSDRVGGQGQYLVSENAHYCRRKAVACWRAAKRTRDPQRRQELEELAQAWMRLADRAEHGSEWEVRPVGIKKTDTE